MFRLLLACSLLGAPAWADDFEGSLSTDQIRALMHQDVDGERWSIVPFAATGLVTFGAGAGLLASDSRIGQTAAWPLMIGGGLELLAGIFFAARAGPHQRRLDALLDSDPRGFAAAERNRVFRIRDRFQPILLAAEAAIAVGGLGTAGAGLAGHDDVLIGIGLGLAIQGLALFFIDWDVLERATTYARGLALFIP